MTLFRKILWGITIFTYVVFGITIIGMIFDPYGHSFFGGAFSVCCLYDMFSFIIGGFNIVGWIVMFIHDRVQQVEFEIRDILLLLMNIAIIPASFWFLWQALMGV